jgi:hypothetical protein
MDSGFLAAHGHAPLNAVLGVGSAAGLPLTLSAAGGILPSGSILVDVPAVGESLVYLGRPVRGLLRRLCRCGTLCLRRLLDALRLRRRLEALRLHNAQFSVVLCLHRRLLLVVVILHLRLLAVDE